MAQPDPASTDGTSGPGPAPDPDLPATVAALADADNDESSRTRLLTRLVREQLRERGLKGMWRPRAAIAWTVDAVGRVVPHLPVRDLPTLREHHDGLSGDALAERLVRNAARATAGIGAAGGGVAAVEWVATPTLLSAPVLLAAETVGVVAVEIKLIAELHEVYGQPIRGSAAERTVALLRSWAERRGVNPLTQGRGAAAALNTAARKELREQLVRRFGRSLGSLGPLMTGAAVAGYLNRRATLSIGEEVSKDLARRQVIDA
jgi:hypothetical protein